MFPKEIVVVEEGSRDAMGEAQNELMYTFINMNNLFT